MYCRYCGSEIFDDAVVCVHCGRAVEPLTNHGSGNRGMITLLLCLLAGGIGAHRFYTGHTATGIAMLLTCGGCLVWWLIDLIRILLGDFRDENGQKVIVS